MRAAVLAVAIINVIIIIIGGVQLRGHVGLLQPDCRDNLLVCATGCHAQLVVSSGEVILRHLGWDVEAGCTAVTNGEQTPPPHL